MIPQTSMPVVSVLMSTYNESLEWIDESIESIRGQTFTNFEYIIVDDNPNRQELKAYLIAKSKSDKRLKIVFNKENLGLTKSLNIGLDYCRGMYIARMDADDISMPDRLEKQVIFLSSHPEVGVVGSNILLFGQNDRIQKYPERDEDCFIFQRSPFAHPVVMIRRCIMKDNSLYYNPEFRYAQDYELWSRMQSLTSFYNLQEILLKYRMTEEQVSRQNNKGQQLYGAKIRRKGFCDFCKKKNIFFELPEELAIKHLSEFKKVVFPIKMTLKEKEACNDFYYYMYRSITTSSGLSVLWYLIKKADFRYLSIEKMLKVFYYNLFRHHVNPML